MDKFMKSIMSLIINLTADKNDLQLLKLAFKEIDKDNNGTITYKEFKQYEGELSEFGLTTSWRFVLEKITNNKQGVLSYNDFISAACDHRRLTSD